MGLSRQWGEYMIIWSLEAWTSEHVGFNSPLFRGRSLFRKGACLVSPSFFQRTSLSRQRGNYIIIWSLGAWTAEDFGWGSPRRQADLAPRQEAHCPTGLAARVPTNVPMFFYSGLLVLLFVTWAGYSLDFSVSCAMTLSLLVSLSLFFRFGTH